MTVSKELSKREKIMIVALAIVILAVGWLKLLYEPTMNQISQLNSKMIEEQTEIQVRIPKIAKIKSMKEELEVLKSDSNSETIPQFDNSKQIMNIISSVMKRVNDYNIKFLPDTTNGYIVEHPINLSFTTDTYTNARALYDELDRETFVNQISDLKIETEESDDGESLTTVSMLITFFDLKN